ncbi:MAG: DnaJ domain-containing protein [Verrucomicrobia bacterium]|jgi:curved DNA-binding protein|nr:DnaJ domain-containing protein [Verrucomicrobiota bacterium]
MIAEYKDYYRILGIAGSASQDEIRLAYRKLARQFHPDVAENKQTGEELFKEISEAYEVLSNPAKRKEFRRTAGRRSSTRSHSGFPRSNRQHQPSDRWNWQQSPDPATARKPKTEPGRESFFDSYDTQAPNPGRTSDPRPRFGYQAYPSYGSQRQDLEANLEISFKEVVLGVDRAIAVLLTNPITGERTETHIHLQLKPGLQEGQIICLPGKGNLGIGGAPRGDLILRVRFARNSEFRARGLDLYREVEINPWVSMFGGLAKVGTLTGSVSLRIPARVRSGQTFRVRGRGLVAEDGACGDLYVRVSHRLNLAVAPVAKTFSFIRKKLARAA